MKKPQHIELMPHEIQQNMYDIAGTAATLFAGEVPEECLRERAKEIFLANPWLGARLISEKGQTPYLHIPESPDFETFYQQVNIGEVCESGGGITNLIEESFMPTLNPKLATIFTKQGFKSLNRDEALYKIRTCVGDDGMFILTVSMSHILGDGATLYRIYEMLDINTKVDSLHAERSEAFPDILSKMDCLPGSCWMPNDIDAQNNPRLEWILKSSSMQSTKESRQLRGLQQEFDYPDALARYANSKDGDDAQQPNSGFFLLDKEWILSQQKKYRKAGKMRVTGNDVVTSWFMNISEVDAGIMAIDSRSFLPQLDNSFAGNYQVCLLYFYEEFETPVGIRPLLKALVKGSSSGEQIKETQANTGHESTALVTSWEKFFKEINIGGETSQLLHIPLSPPELGTPSHIDSAMIIFRPKAGELAVALNSDRLEELVASGAIKGPLFA